MLRLYQSNRLEALVEQLAGVLSAPLPSVFSVEEIIVPHPGMGRWLALQLADKQGICANTSFPLPAAFIWTLFRQLFDDVPKFSGFEPGVLDWRICTALERLDEAVDAPTLKAYLRHADERMLHELSQKIAASFDQYLVYRPDWIQRWEANESAVAGDEWQAGLWRELVTAHTGKHWVYWQQVFYTALERGSIDFSALPERLSLFAIQTLSPGYLEILNRLSEHVDVHLFLLNPCAEYWTEIVSEAQLIRQKQQSDVASMYMDVGHPLLASMGGQGRDFFTAILDHDPGMHDLFEDAGTQNLLHKVQSDILNLNDGDEPFIPPPSGERDQSIQIHACHSPMREIEVLQDQLLNLIEHDSDISPQDILVMMPDIGTYAPFINAVFAAGGDRPFIPYQIADQSWLDDAPLTVTFLELLKIPHGRFDIETVLHVLSTPAVMRRFGFSSQDYPLLVQWIKDVGIRWGEDAANRKSEGLPEEEQNTWRAGLDSLLLGYALPRDDLHLFNDILPHPDIEGSNALLMAALQDFTRRLFRLKKDLLTAKSMPEWVQAVQHLLETFFDPDQDEEYPLQVIRDSVARLAEQTEAASYTQHISLERFTWLMESQLNKGNESYGFLRGGVTFCALTPLRSLPFKVICLLGMNDGSFPRGSYPPDFDLMQSNFRLGDRSRRADDRYLFLETLISARQVLYISYVGQHIRDNSALPPSVLVSELQDYLLRLVPEVSAEHAFWKPVITHPLQAYSPDYFRSDNDLFSYSKRLADASKRLGEVALKKTAFIQDDLPEPEDTWRQLDLVQLENFYANPTKYLLYRRLGILLTEEDALPESRDPFELDRFSRSDWSAFIVQQIIEKNTSNDIQKMMQASAILPHGEYGHQLYQELYSEADSFSKRLESIDTDFMDEALSIDLNLAGMDLTGSLNNINPAGQAFYSVHKIRDGQLIAFWLRHLCLNILAPKGISLTSHWLDNESLYQLHPVESASEILTDLLCLYWTGLQKPLHFFPRSAKAYVDVCRQNKPEDAALQKAYGVWIGSGFSWGESQNSYYRTAFSGQDVLDDEFVSLSQQVFNPLFDHLRKVE